MNRDGSEKILDKMVERDSYRDSHIAILIESSQVLDRELSTHAAFKQILEILKRRYGLIRGAVALLEENTREIRIEESIGLTCDGRFTSYTLGEGITGKVVESGKPIVVPQASLEPMFLNRAGNSDLSGNEVSYICVPIFVKGRTVGALGVDLPFMPNRDYSSELKYFALIAGMIGQAIKAEYVTDDERPSLYDENQHILEDLRQRYEFSEIIGAAGPIRRVFEQIAQIAHTNTNVLIRGESGTGKELIANAIHRNSPHAKNAFIKVNCAALPDGLIESQLFGYEKGAFTDAQGTKKGRFELAEGGTLFLDEIGDMKITTQVKLMRVLQEREFDRLGGTNSIPANVRLIAGTNIDLEKAMAEGKFRDDLYYRLNFFAIVVPPLRERRSDLLLLAHHFLQKYARAHMKDIRRISTATVDMLSAYHWPGNVRELENVIERAVLVCESNVLHGYNLPPTLQTAQASGAVPTLSFADIIAGYEKDLILGALKTTRGNRSKAATLLKTTDRIINYKVRKYEIDISRFRT